MPNIAFIDPGPSAFERALRGTAMIGQLAQGFQQAQLQNQLLKNQISRNALEDQALQLNIQRDQFRFGQEQQAAPMQQALLADKVTQSGYETEASAFAPAGAQQQLYGQQLGNQAKEFQNRMLPTEAGLDIAGKQQGLARGQQQLAQGRQELEQGRFGLEQMKNAKAAIPHILDLARNTFGLNFSDDFWKQMKTMVLEPKTLGNVLQMFQHKGELDMQNSRLQSGLQMRMLQQEATAKRAFMNESLSAAKAAAGGDMNGISVLEAAIGSGPMSEDPYYSGVLNALKQSVAKAGKKGGKVEFDQIIQSALDLGDEDTAADLIAGKNNYQIPSQNSAQLLPELARERSTAKESLLKAYKDKPKATATTQPTGPVVITSQAEWEKLAPGTPYTWNGRTGTKR